MKRDTQLIREILLTIDSDKYASDISYYSESQVKYHVLILHGGGFLHNNQLTKEGHEFVNNLRSDLIFEKAQRMIKDKVGHVSVKVLQVILKHMKAQE